MIRLDRRSGFGLVALAVLATLLAWQGLVALGAARARVATLAMQASAGAQAERPLLENGLGYRQATRPAALAALAGRVRQAAAERRLLVERIEPLPQDDAVRAELAVAISLSGPEADVLHLARRIETGRPAARFAAWRIARTGRAETAVRLEARLVAYWEPGR